MILNYFRRVRNRVEARWLTLVEKRIDFALDYHLGRFAAARRDEKRLCGILVFGRTIYSTPTPVPSPPEGLSNFLQPDDGYPPEARRRYRPAAVHPLLGSMSALLAPNEEHVFKIFPQTTIGPSSLIVAWGCCELLEVCAGNEAANAWPGNGLALIAPPTALRPGTLLQARVKGWAP